jgi:tetratricopeptide (TPR) repeat protein
MKAPRLVLLILLAACSGRFAARATLAPASPQAATTAAVDAHFLAAQKAQARQDYSTAEREYRAVLALTPEFAEAHMNLGLIYQLQNRVPAAMTEFRRALRIKPALAGANFFLGVDYCRQGEGAEAVPYLKTAARAQPNQPDIWSWLATAQEMSGETSTEAATLKQGLSFQPSDADLLYLLGHAYERLGQDEARYLKKSDPGSSYAEQLLAQSYSASGDWPLAEIHFQNALAASPNRDGLHADLGEVLLRAGRLAEAGQEFESELRLDPRSLRAIVRRGELRLIEGDVDGSLQDWAEAIAAHPSQAEAMLGIRETGFGDSALEQLPEALREKLETLAPSLRARNSPAAHFALAFLAAQRGDLSQAAVEAGRALGTPAASMRKTDGASSACSEDEVHQALEQERSSAFARCALATLSRRSRTALRIQVARGLFEAGDYQASLEALSGLPPADSRSPEASFWRARCYEKLATAAYLKLDQAHPNSYRVHQLLGDLDAAKGDDVKAMAEYRAAIAEKPELPNLHYSLGRLLWKARKVADARQEFQAELAINPRHAGALEDMGDTYLFEHQARQALPYLDRAIEADRSNPDVHRDLGTAYTELGDYQKAEAELKIAVRDDHDGSVHYKLAKVYQALGQKEEAAREFALSTTLNREVHRQLEEQTERLSRIERSAQDD